MLPCLERQFGSRRTFGNARCEEVSKRGREKAGHVEEKPIFERLLRFLRVRRRVAVRLAHILDHDGVCPGASACFEDEAKHELGLPKLVTVNELLTVAAMLLPVAATRADEEGITSKCCDHRHVARMLECDEDRSVLLLAELQILRRRRRDGSTERCFAVSDRTGAMRAILIGEVGGSGLPTLLPRRDATQRAIWAISKFHVVAERAAGVTRYCVVLEPNVRGSVLTAKVSEKTDEAGTDFRTFAFVVLRRFGSGVRVAALQSEPDASAQGAIMDLVFPDADERTISAHALAIGQCYRLRYDHCSCSKGDAGTFDVASDALSRANMSDGSAISWTVPPNATLERVVFRARSIASFSVPPLDTFGQREGMIEFSTEILLNANKFESVRSQYANAMESPRARIEHVADFIVRGKETSSSARGVVLSKSKSRKGQIVLKLGDERAPRLFAHHESMSSDAVLAHTMSVVIDLQRVSEIPPIIVIGATVHCVGIERDGRDARRSSDSKTYILRSARSALWTVSLEHADRMYDRRRRVDASSASWALRSPLSLSRPCGRRTWLSDICPMRTRRDNLMNVCFTVVHIQWMTLAWPCSTCGCANLANRCDHPTSDCDRAPGICVCRPRGNPEKRNAATDMIPPAPSSTRARVGGAAHFASMTARVRLFFTPRTPTCSPF